MNYSQKKSKILEKLHGIKSDEITSLEFGDSMGK
jgi:hypothetical protein